jgi:hypothetical protein
MLYTKTYPTESTQKRAQVAQKGPYVETATLAVFITAL